MPLPVFVEQQLIWLVCLAFYIADNVYLIKDRELLIHETIVGSWMAKFARIPFMLNGKHAYFANPFIPYSLVLRLSWLQTEPHNRRKLSSTQRVLWLLQRRAAGFRFIATASFLNLFLLGPCLTILVGLGIALIIVALIHLALIAITIINIWKCRAFLGFTSTEVVLLVPEYIFCPGHIVNIVRKISWRFRQLHADGGAFCCEYTHDKSKTCFREAMTYRLDELMAEADVDSTEMATIKSYQAELKL